MQDATPRRAPPAAPIRQIIYQSTLGPGIAPPEIAQMATRAGQKNRATRVTGRLLEAEGRFLQLIEGDPGLIGQLYTTIAFDRRHAAVTTLADRRATSRSYGDWSMRSGPWSALQAEASGELEPILHHLRYPPARQAFAGPGPLGRDPARDLRVEPRQPRGKASLQRLFDAARAMALATGRFDHLTLPKVAGEARLAASSAYRYVPDIEALFRLAVQRQQAENNRRFLAFMANRDFPDELALAEAAVDFSIARALAPRPLPQAKLLKAFMRRYHQVRSEVAWALAEAILAGLPPQCPCRAIGVTQLAAGLLAMLASRLAGVPQRLHIAWGTALIPVLRPLLSLFLHPCAELVTVVPLVLAHVLSQPSYEDNMLAFIFSMAMPRLYTGAAERLAVTLACLLI